MNYFKKFWVLVIFIAVNPIFVQTATAIAIGNISPTEGCAPLTVKLDTSQSTGKIYWREKNANSNFTFGKNAANGNVTSEVKLDANDSKGDIGYGKKVSNGTFASSKRLPLLALLLDQAGNYEWIASNRLVVVNGLATHVAGMKGVKRTLAGFIDALGLNTLPKSFLVTFGDEVKYPVVIQNMIGLRNTVKKRAGGDTCPEASVEALIETIFHVKKGGTIMFATDASPYEDAGVNGMIVRLRSNDIIFDAIDNLMVPKDKSLTTNVFQIQRNIWTLMEKANGSLNSVVFSGDKINVARNMTKRYLS